MRFGEILIEAGFCTPRQIWSALEYADHKQLPIGSVLKMQNVIDDAQLEVILAAQKSIRDGTEGSVAVAAVRQALRKKTQFTAAMSQLGIRQQLPNPAQPVDPLASLSSKTKAQINSFSLLTKADKAFRDNKPVEAEQQYKQAIAELEAIHGQDSPDIDLALTKLANFYLAMQSFAEAEQLYGRVLDIRRQHFGKESTAYAAAAENLADLFLTKQNHTLAEALLSESILIREKQPTLELDGYVKALKRLQVLYADRKPDAKLLRLGRMVCDCGMLTPQNLDIALSASGTTLIPLGNVLTTKGFLSKMDLRSVLTAQLMIKERKLCYPVAMKVLKLASDRKSSFKEFVRQISLLPPSDRDDPADYKELVQLRERLQDIEETFGPQHMDVARAAIDLGDAHVRRGDLLDAEMLWRRASAIIKMMGGSPQMLGDVGCRTADLLLKMQRIDDAKAELVDALEAYRQVGPAANAVAAGLLQRLALIEYRQGNMNIAAEYLSKELAVILKGQPVAPLPAEDLRWMVDCLIRANSAAYAEGVLLKQIESARNHFGELDPEVGNYLELLGDFYACGSAQQKAETHYNFALNIYDQSFGPNHPRVVELMKKLRSSSGATQQQGQSLGIGQSGDGKFS